MSDENQQDTPTPEADAAGETAATEAATVPSAEATPAPEAEATAPEARDHGFEADAPEETQDEVETVMCMVSKKMVPLDETIEIERKKGEVLRLHQRYKKFA